MASVHPPRRLKARWGVPPPIPGSFAWRALSLGRKDSRPGARLRSTRRQSAAEHGRACEPLPSCLIKQRGGLCANVAGVGLAVAVGQFYERSQVVWQCNSPEDINESRNIMLTSGC